MRLSVCLAVCVYVHIYRKRECFLVYTYSTTHVVQLHFCAQQFFCSALTTMTIPALIGFPFTGAEYTSG